jgi:cyclopropane fatty-acyl-phospholipid synthase-like methyltransferase
MPGARVVDVACGSGATTLLLARELGCVTVGVDLGARAIDHARRATPAGARGL